MSCFAGPGLITNGLVLCLDAGNIESYPGSGTTWSDLSGMGNNGTLTSGPTYSTANGGTIVFDGTNDRINVPISCDKTYYSINWWLYPNTLTNYNHAMTFNANGLTWGAFVFHASTSGAVFIGTDVATRLSSTDLPANTIVANTWHNLTYTFNNGVGSFYKNGVLLATKSAMTISSADFTTFYIGLGNTNTINGYLPNISIYSNKVLSDAEVLQNFNALRGRYSI